MWEREIDEILEIIWMEREKGKKNLGVIQTDIKEQKLQDVLGEMENLGLIKIEKGEVWLTTEGEKKALDLIRRHRLAERLLMDVLETKKEEMEESACKFEHILSEEV
ncbi:MAG: metal-dependent transcriptional regulator, partial [Candidatus Margulisiibacteriota bacterium]